MVSSIGCWEGWNRKVFGVLEDRRDMVWSEVIEGMDGVVGKETVRVIATRVMENRVYLLERLEPIIWFHEWRRILNDVDEGDEASWLAEPEYMKRNWVESWVFAESAEPTD